MTWSTRTGLDQVFEVLRAPYTEEPTNWSRRYKANLEKLASGDVIKVAEVVRDLWRRDRTAACPPARSACWPRPGRSWCPSWRSPRSTNEDKAEAILDEVLAS